MKKDDKEKNIVNVRLKQIERMDTDISSMFFKIWAGFFAFFFGLYSLKVFDKENLVFWIITFVVIYIILLIVQSFYEKYIWGCYNSLSKAINENKLLTFELPLPWGYSLFIKSK